MHGCICNKLESTMLLVALDVLWNTKAKGVIADEILELDSLGDLKET